MKRKLLSTMLALCVAAGTAAAPAAAGQVHAAQNSAAGDNQSPEDGSGAGEEQPPEDSIQSEYEYRTEGNSITITRYLGTAAELEIPAEIDEKPVNAIGDGAFRGCRSLRNVTVPDSVKDIGDEAFDSCGNLESITLPDSLTSIKDYTFVGCGSLETITIPSSAVRIGEEAFSSCISLTSVTIPAGVEDIDRSAFAGCSRLKELTISEGVKSIYDGAFSSCGSLTNVTIPEGVTYIGEAAFSSCTELKSITIPTSTNTIGDGAFRGCDSLAEVQFAGTKAQRKKINITGNGNKALLKASIHYSGSSESERLGPKKGAVLKSGSNSYKVSSVISQVAFKSTTSKNTQVTIPSYIRVDGISYKVKSVSKNALKNNKKITKVTIDYGIQSIGSSAFNGCSKLKSIVVKSSDLTSVGSNALKGIKSTAQIKVPSYQLEEYEELFQGKGQGSKVTITEWR